ncbi:DUF5320 domain-containing protein [Patescibacteria group bacterium]|nr:DUF5320 domain-containing protein [Patescibacteria group bacterium]MBU1931473.1 DUF5320 domain-containing protein [Patescibacteria group bacterium]
MPGFDGTGPRGMGPMTGRGCGPCSCCGYGRRSFFPRWSQKNQAQDLKDYQACLKEELEAVEKELVELNKEE